MYKKVKDLVAGSFALLVSVCLTLMIVTVFTNAVLRYAFASGIPAGEELARYLFIWITALGTILAYRDNKHIGVDLLVSALKGTPRSIVVNIGRGIVIVSFLLVGYGGIEFFKTSAASPGPATGIPFGTVSISIIVIAISVIVLTVRDILRDAFASHRENR